MVGIGAANIASGFFQGFPVSASSSRTAVAEQSGGKTQVTGLVGAAVISVMLVALPALFSDLPQPALGAVVIAAAISLVDLPGARRLWHQRRGDFVVMLVAFLGVAVLGVLPGIVVAIAISVGNVFRRVWWPHTTLLGREPGEAGLHDLERHPDAQILPHYSILRFDAPLIFANTRAFRDQVRDLARAQGGGWVIVASEPITDVDTTACDMLDDLAADLRRHGVTLVFAELKGVVRDKLRAYELDPEIPDEQFFPTLEGAVEAYRAQTGEAWQEPVA
jgi:MFS superfamily sulfate permease-like transporter